MKNTFFVILLLLALVITSNIQAQVGIGIMTADPSAQLDVTSTSKGFLPPRMTTTERDAISSPASGLVIFNTTTNSLEYKSSTGWVSLTASTSTVIPDALPTIQIGAQKWMKENLNTSFYRNGYAIPQITNATDWASATEGAWCYYNNDPANGEIYGKLYNWYAVNDPRGLAPTGWHVPTEDEWTTLTTTLGGGSVAGGKMKVAGTTRWTAPNTGASNSSGFAGLPGGTRDSNGSFGLIGGYGIWWSSTENDATVAWYRYLNYSLSDVYRDLSVKSGGFSVRCLRD